MRIHSIDAMPRLAVVCTVTLGLACHAPAVAGGN